MIPSDTLLPSSISGIPAETASSRDSSGRARVGMFSAPRAVMVAGPTASGKSAFALRLAEKIGGVVISADSMQIYRGLDIGTAKETPESRAAIPHELIDIVDAAASFSVSEFASAAEKAAKTAATLGKIPVVVGGTGFYFESLVRPLGFGGTPSDEALRARLSALFDEEGGAKMLELLRETDPETAARLHPNDKKRIVRALEIVELTSSPMSAQKDEYDGDFIMVCFNSSDRQKLYDRINARVDEMFSAGLPQEAAYFLGKIGKNAQSMQAIGYKEFAPYMDEYAANGAFSSQSLSEIAEAVKKNTRNYAKRQITWFRRYPFVKWFEIGDFDGAENYVMSRLRGENAAP